MKLKKGMFRAQIDFDLEDYFKRNDYTPDVINDKYVYGYYVDGYIVGKIDEVNDEFINFDYWISVDTNTLEIFSGYVDGQEIWIKFKLEEN